MAKEASKYDTASTRVETASLSAAESMVDSISGRLAAGGRADMADAVAVIPQSDNYMVGYPDGHPEASDVEYGTDLTPPVPAFREAGQWNAGQHRKTFWQELFG